MLNKAFYNQINQGKKQKDNLGCLIRILCRKLMYLGKNMKLRLALWNKNMSKHKKTQNSILKIFKTRPNNL